MPGDKEFWCITCDAHIKVASASWCMIFGVEKSNPTHWKRLFNSDLEINEFKNLILVRLGITSDDWTNYWKEITAFRNEFVVHREINFSKPVPYFHWAYETVILFDKWIRIKIAPDYMNFEQLERVSNQYRANITESIL